MNARRLKRRSLRIWYIAAAAVFALLLRFVFTRFDSGMLISVFIIDLVMAIDFVVEAKRISPSGQLPIAITKLAGDLFAWLSYMHESKAVAIMGAAVLIINTFYLALCLEKGGKSRSRKGGA